MSGTGQATADASRMEIAGNLVWLGTLGGCGQRLGSSVKVMSGTGQATADASRMEIAGNLVWLGNLAGCGHRLGSSVFSHLFEADSSYHVT